MWVYGLPFHNGMVFHDRNFNTLRFSLRKIDFGYTVEGEIPVSFEKKVEVFKVKANSAQIFGEMCVVGQDFVVGFLKHNGGVVEIEKQEGYLVGYLSCYKKGFKEGLCSKSSFAILQGYEREFLLKEYLRLVAKENEIVSTPSPLTALTATFRGLDQRIFEAKNCGCEVLLLRELEGPLEDFVRKCRNNDLLAGIEVEYEPVRVEKLRKHGFQFFEVSFEKNDRNDIERARQTLRDLILVAKGISPLTAIALTDGLVLKSSEMNLQDLVKNSLLQKVIPLYVEVDDFDDKWSKVCSVLGCGVIFNKRADRVDYARVSCVGKVYAQQCEIIYFDKNDVHKKILVSKDSLRTEYELAWQLVKHTKTRQDGRFFHFYGER